MASGNRETWARLLPIIQAFVDGKRIQTLDYDKRWKDTDVMQSLLHNSYRIKPEGMRQGIWTIEYTITQPGSSKGAVGRGIMSWEGSNCDQPAWMTIPGISYDKSSERFVAKAE